MNKDETLSALQSIWYGKLKQEKFKDVEGFKDLNQYSVSTFGRRISLIGGMYELDIVSKHCAL